MKSIQQLAKEVADGQPEDKLLISVIPIPERSSNPTALSIQQAISLLNFIAVNYAPVYRGEELVYWEPITRQGNWKTTEEVVREWENQNQTS